MAIIRMKNVREMNEKDLDEKLREFKLELSKSRASSEIGTVKNPGIIREIRRGIARILTEKSKRRAGIQARALKEQGVLSRTTGKK
jgi:large subunit ribosomal protein L29